MSISLCLIVKNEEKTLGSCLESFSSLAEEIIVVDTGSEDKTKEIASQFKAKIFDFEWVDDFSAARNFALSKASKEWIMMVDADDCMSEENMKLLSKELSLLGNETEIISLPYVYQQSGKNNMNTAYLPRLWKRSLKLEYKYPIHEYLDMSKVDHQKRRRFNLPIVHKKPETSFKASFQRNVRILEKYLQKQPKDLRALYYIIQNSNQLGDCDAVIHWTSKYLDAGPENEVEVCRALVLKGKCHLKKGKLMLAQEAFLLANGANPLLIEPYLALGDLHKTEKRYAEAVHMYRCAELCKKPKLSHVFYNQSMYDYYAQKKLAETLPLIGEPEEAIRYTKMALEYLPQDKSLLNQLERLTKEINQT